MEQSFFEKMHYGNDEASFLEATMYRAVSTAVYGSAAYFGWKYYKSRQGNNRLALSGTSRQLGILS
jgi:predicted negative regulator of RcsB-dependent stress response